MIVAATTHNSRRTNAIDDIASPNGRSTSAFTSPFDIVFSPAGRSTARRRTRTPSPATAHRRPSPGRRPGGCTPPAGRRRGADPTPCRPPGRPSRPLRRCRRDRRRPTTSSTTASPAPARSAPSAARGEPRRPGSTPTTMMSARTPSSEMVWRNTITGDASGPATLAGTGTNDVNGPDASSDTAHASASIACSVRSTSRENDSDRPVMISPIANTSATPTMAITKRFHRHCRVAQCCSEHSHSLPSDRAHCQRSTT